MLTGGIEDADWMSLDQVLNLQSNDARVSGYGDKVKDCLASKRRDPGYPALVENLRREGFTIPLSVYDGKLFDGHHRVAAAEDLGIISIPVIEDMFTESDSGWCRRFVNSKEGMII